MYGPSGVLTVDSVSRAADSAHRPAGARTGRGPAQCTVVVKNMTSAGRLSPTVRWPWPATLADVRSDCERLRHDLKIRARQCTRNHLSFNPTTHEWVFEAIPKRATLKCSFKKPPTSTACILSAKIKTFAAWKIRMAVIPLPYHSYHTTPKQSEFRSNTGIIPVNPEHCKNSSSGVPRLRNGPRTR